jgi:mono/diheme cytochrome c family protein
MIPAVMRRRLAIVVLIAAAGGAVACGAEGISPAIKSQPANVQRGALLFSQRCSGCHTLDVVGAQGTTLNVRQREHTDGPNFNVRREQVPNILYAIRNGGFSGAIMPQNVVVGQDANDVAAFLSKYSGLQASENSSATAGQQQSEQ